MSAYRLPVSQKNTDELLQQLEAEIKECTEVRSTYANKVKKFMIANEIWHLEELDYFWRVKYEEFLKSEVKPVSCSTYIKGFDRMKQHTICGKVHLSGKKKYNRPEYKNQILFLLYHPEPEVFKKFNNTVKKQDLLWDFSIQASEILKRQIFQILHHIIENVNDTWWRRMYLMALKQLYRYCVEMKIDTIEWLEQNQIDKFKNSSYSQNIYREFDIVNYAQKVLFLEADEIPWNANVWYMERIRLQRERTNPSAPVGTISFLEIVNRENRKLAKQYVKYNLGLTDLSLSSIAREFYYIRCFLISLPPDICVCSLTRGQTERVLQQFENRGLKEKTYNMILAAIVHFFQFLRVRNYITEIPFQPEYYRKKEIVQHHDRSVDKSITAQIVSNLYRFPEQIRLIYLHLWTLGLRISEVCTLKGNAYYIWEKDAWIQVYQIKSRTYKRIPIPYALYQLMSVYLKRNKISQDEYVFKNTHGGAFCRETFIYNMKRYCKICGIGNGEYVFRSHDYRHGVATQLYDSEVPLQSIRDYLGHEYEEMTLQYVDYMPRKADNANEEFFKNTGNNLAECLRKESNERTDLF